MKFKLFNYKKVKSTNEKAIKLIKINKINSGCVCADIQTKGRGTYGKKWVSKKGNFFGSVFFPLKKNYPSSDQFSLINPVIVSNIIQIFCDKRKLKIKFPNDIFLNGKKICGILQEIISIDKKNFLIIGVGLNVNSNPSIKKKYKATNIFSETQIRTTTNEIAALLIKSYEIFFLNLKYFDYSHFKKKTDLMAFSIK